MVGGRLREWRVMHAPDLGRPPAPAELADVTERVVARGAGDGLGAHLPAEEVDEVRIIGGWLAAHPETPLLPLADVPSAGDLCDFLAPMVGDQ
jgi:hypothetical protein